MTLLEIHYTKTAQPYQNNYYQQAKCRVLKFGSEKETTGEVTVSVKDRGRGIDQEIRDR